MDCSPPGFSVHEILQARILEWVAISSSRGSFQPRDQTVSLASPELTGDFFSTSTTWECSSLTLLQKPDSPSSYTKQFSYSLTLLAFLLFSNPCLLLSLFTSNRCESWTVKKAECQRIDAFELWCWKRLLRVPWTARRSYQSILKEISPGCSLEGMMLKLKLQLMWPPHVKSWLIGKDSDASRDWGQEEKGTTENEMDGWHHRLDGHEFEWTPGVGDGQGGLACCDSWGRKESDTTEWLNWLTDTYS